MLSAKLVNNILASFVSFWESCESKAAWLREITNSQNWPAGQFPTSWGLLIRAREGEERERPLPACDHDVFFHVATNHICGGNLQVLKPILFNVEYACPVETVRQAMCDRKCIRDWQKSLSFLSFLSCCESREAWPVILKIKCWCFL